MSSFSSGLAGSLCSSLRENYSMGDLKECGVHSVEQLAVFHIYWIISHTKGARSWREVEGQQRVATPLLTASPHIRWAQLYLHCLKGLATLAPNCLSRAVQLYNWLRCLAELLASLASYWYTYIDNGTGSKWGETWREHSCVDWKGIEHCGFTPWTGQWEALKEYWSHSMGNIKECGVLACRRQRSDIHSM